MIGLQWGDEAKGKIVDLLTVRMISSFAIRAEPTPATPWSPADRPTILADSQRHPPARRAMRDHWRRRPQSAEHPGRDRWTIARGVAVDKNLVLATEHM